MKNKADICIKGNHDAFGRGLLYFSGYLGHAKHTGKRLPIEHFLFVDKNKSV